MLNYIGSGFADFGVVKLSFSSLRDRLFPEMVVAQSYQSN